MSVWELWLLTVMPNVGNIIGFVGVLLSIISAVLGVYGMLSIYDRSLEVESGLLLFRKSLIGGVIAIFMILIGAIIPSKQDLYFILGGHYVTNIEGIDKLPPSIIKATNAFLESLDTTKSTREFTK